MKFIKFVVLPAFYLFCFMGACAIVMAWAIGDINPTH